jgi:5S rRNA maturation endonuclease (ribonuclease M5)
MSQWVDFRVLKQNISIERVLASYRVALQRVGQNQLRGACPLPTHGSERSRQSFSVDTAKNVWTCHSASGCELRQGRVGGNVLDLVGLAGGVHDSGCRAAPARPGMRLARQNLPARATGFKRELQQQQSGSTAATDVLSGLRWHPYLEQRGVHRSTKLSILALVAAAARFGVGCYGGSGFLRQRIVFPIHDSQGRLVAYAGRSIDDSEPRYLFPPGFRKSQVVFNLQHAMQEAAQCAIVVEGFFDCLRVHQAGYRNVVALMGVSLSEMQEKILLERFPQLVLMLDGDEAGRRASQQLVGRLAGKVAVAVTEMASGRQPDQLSSEEVQRVLQTANVAPRRA